MSHVSLFKLRPDEHDDEEEEDDDDDEEEQQAVANDEAMLFEQHLYVQLVIIYIYM